MRVGFLLLYILAVLCSFLGLAAPWFCNFQVRYFNAFLTQLLLLIKKIEILLSKSPYNPSCGWEDQTPRDIITLDARTHAILP